MTITTRLSAWWLAWKWVVVLVALLGLSVWLNIHQWKLAITAPLRAEVAAKDEALDTSQGLLQDTRDSATRLERAASEVATNLNQASATYRKVARQQPLPAQCAPGQGRMDAVNRALGAPEDQ